MMRTFVAFDTTPGQKATLTNTVAALRRSGADVRWESPDKFHVTLKFLGETEEGALNQICDRISAVCANAQPMTLSINRLGCFPNLRQPRVIWAGCKTEYPELHTLKTQLEKALKDCGFDSEKQTFHPHITLGRVRGIRGINDLISTLKTVTFESFNLSVGNLVLVKSVLHRSGSVYSTLESFTLGGKVVS